MNALYFILISLFWGGSFLAINLSLEGFSPFLAASLRVLVAAVITFAYISWKHIRFPRKRHAIQAMTNGILGVGIPWALLFWGEQFVAPALCSIINATSPIFTAVFAATLMRSREEMLTWNKWLGVATGLAGIIVIFGPAVSKGSFTDVGGLAAIVLMAIFYGLSIAWIKKISLHMQNTMMLFLECMGALIFLVPATVFTGFSSYFVKPAFILTSSLAILYLGLFSTTIALILFFRLVRNVGSVAASATTYCVPVISIILDWLVLDRWVGNQALLGALIVFAALSLTNKQGEVNRRSLND